MKILISGHTETQSQQKRFVNYANNYTIVQPVTAAERERNADLNLQENENGLLECRGRIVGHYPLYLPNTTWHFSHAV